MPPGNDPAQAKPVFPGDPLASSPETAPAPTLNDVTGPPPPAPPIPAGRTGHVPGDGPRDTSGPETPRPTVPPDLDAEPRPPSMEAQVQRMIKQAMSESGPEAAALAKQLLDSDNPELRAVGAALLSEVNALDAETLRRVAEDADLAVPLNTLGYLHDHGRVDAFRSLAGLLPGGRLSGEGLVSAIERGHINGSGIRVGLDLLHASGDPGASRELYDALANDAAQEYAVRMKATMLMRDAMAFEDYRREVNRLSAQGANTDPLWQEGISRLSTRLEGPLPVHDAAPTLTRSDIDERLAREFPMTLEDLAQHLEYVLARNDAYIQPGASMRLDERLTELRALPWTDEQQLSMGRLESAVPALQAREDPDSPPPPHLSLPPPGAGN